MRSKTLVWNLLAVTALAAGLAACKTPQPANDKTPPTLRWAVVAPDNQQLSFNGSGTINAKMGDTFTVTLIAEDPEGIHEIHMGQNKGWSCKSGNIGQSAGPGLGVDHVQTLQPDAQGNVLTKIFLIDNADISGFTCQSGFKFAGGSVVFNGSGINYANQKVTGTLTINVAAP